MTGALPWRRRHPLAAVLVLLLVPLAAVAVVLAVRALLVVLSIGPRAEYWQERAEQPGEVVQVALGDSLSQGIGSSRPETSFVNVLSEDLRRRTGSSVRVVNLAVTGATTKQLVDEQLPRLRALLDRLAAEGTPVALVTLAVGANDAGRTPPAEFRRQLGTVLDAVPAGTLVADVPDFNGGPRLDDAAALSQVVRDEVAARPDLVLVRLEDATARLTLADYAADFFHPSDTGYRRYVAAFREALDAAGVALVVPGADR